MRLLRALFFAAALILGASGRSYAQALPPEIPQDALLSVLTPTAATSCTSLEAAVKIVSAAQFGGRLVALVNTSSSGAVNPVLNFYDEGAAPACASADLVFSVRLYPSQVIVLNLPLSNGLAYTLSWEPPSNIMVYRY